jgi:hypothetical protein
VTTGPNSPISNGSLIPAIERQIDFALAFICKIQVQDLQHVVVTDEATDDFNVWKDEFMKGMTWSGGCSSWWAGSSSARKNNHKLTLVCSQVQEWDHEGIHYR